MLSKVIPSNITAASILLWQAEEAQRLRKRRKAETMRLLDMERRQRQRLEEVRETQKKVWGYCHSSFLFSLDFSFDEFMESCAATNV